MCHMVRSPRLSCSSLVCCPPAACLTHRCFFTLRNKLPCCPVTSQSLTFTPTAVMSKRLPPVCCCEVQSENKHGMASTSCRPQGVFLHVCQRSGGMFWHTGRRTSFMCFNNSVTAFALIQSWKLVFSSFELMLAVFFSDHRKVSPNEQKQVGEVLRIASLLCVHVGLTSACLPLKPPLGSRDTRLLPATKRSTSPKPPASWGPHLHPDPPTWSTHWTTPVRWELEGFWNRCYSGVFLQKNPSAAHILQPAIPVQPVTVKHHERGSSASRPGLEPSLLFCLCPNPPSVMDTLVILGKKATWVWWCNSRIYGFIHLFMDWTLPVDTSSDAAAPPCDPSSPSPSDNIIFIHINTLWCKVWTRQEN